MRRRFRKMLLAGVLAATAVVPAAATPAAAHEDACAGHFWLQFDGSDPDSFGYPNLSMRNESSFWLGTPMGLCAVWFQLYGSGWMIGDCGLATGDGWANGHYFTVKWLGDTMTFTGGVVGTVHALVDPFVYRNSCLDGSAWHLLLSGTLVLVH